MRFHEILQKHRFIAFSEKDKGHNFERLMQHYATLTVYGSALRRPILRRLALVRIPPQARFRGERCGNRSCRKNPGQQLLGNFDALRLTSLAWTLRNKALGTSENEQIGTSQNEQIGTKNISYTA